MGEMIELGDNGHRDQGYLAVPASGRGPGVVVIQEWWGLVDHIKRVCDRFAERGVHRAGARPLPRPRDHRAGRGASKQAMNLDIAVATADLSAAVRHLLSSPRVTSPTVGVVGFCMGGGLALSLASQEPAISACVTYYGIGPPTLDVAKMEAAVLGHWGERDHSYDHQAVQRLEENLRAAGVEVESFWYDADHAFFNDDRPEVHAEEAAQLSWDRTVAFLREHVGR